MYIDTVSGGPLLKLYLPVMNSFVLHGGSGLDYYRTKSNHKIFSTSGNSSNVDSTAEAFGTNFSAGFDYYFYKHPVKNGSLDMPLSLFLEYKMTTGTISDFDKDAVSEKNTLNSSTDSSHDFDLGSKNLVIGLRWRF